MDCACYAILLVAIVADSLVPVDWQVRLGLHWLTEHFLAYFALTSIVCLAWPRPMVVAAWLVPFAVLLEALQGLTANRVPDLPTALFGAAGVASAALLADLAWWRKGGRRLPRRAGKPETPLWRGRSILMYPAIYG